MSRTTTATTREPTATEHRRCQTDAAHVWPRRCVHDVFADLAG